MCDDGNNSDGKGCDPLCMSVLPYWSCSGGSPTTLDICVPVYGDGHIVVGSEICDDNNTNSGDGCSPTGLPE